MEKLTDKEMEWLCDADRLFKRKPSKFSLYNCDATIVVCKKGFNVRDMSWMIDNSSINACNVITDVHDDMGYGE